MTWENAARQLGLQCAGWKVWGTQRGHSVEAWRDVRQGFPGVLSVLTVAVAYFAPTFDLDLEPRLQQEVVFDQGQVRLPWRCDRSRVEALLADGRGAALAAVPAMKMMRLTDSRLWLGVLDQHAKDETVIWAIETVAHAAQTLHAARMAVPVKAELASHVAHFDALARDLGLTTIPCPLGVVGAIDGVGVEATARLHRLHCVLEIGASFPTPLDFALALKPQHLPSSIDSLLHGDDLTVGDPDIDRAFRIQTSSPQLLTERLTPPLRADLLALRETGELTIDIAGLRLRASDLAVAAEALPRAARVIAALAGTPQGESHGAFR